MKIAQVIGFLAGVIIVGYYYGSVAALAGFVLETVFGSDNVNYPLLFSLGAAFGVLIASKAALTKDDGAQ